MLALVVSSGSEPADAKELQWRRGRPPQSQAVAQSNRHERHDSAVRPAAWDDAHDVPLQLHRGSGQARLRSIVVDRERAAQIPWDNDTDPQLEEQLRMPFDSQEMQDELETMPPAEIDRRPSPRQPMPAPRQPADITPVDDDFASVDADTLAQERQQAMSICAEELADLRASRLHSIDLSIAVTGTEGDDYPFECTIDDGTWLGGRCWPQTVYMWKASALCHKPLYFENASLERYGHSWGPFVQPLVSGAHFFTRLPVLPYCMGVQPPNECVYALGHYRPGSCAPYMIDPVPISARGAVYQAAAVTGTVFVVP